LIGFLILFSPFFIIGRSSWILIWIIIELRSISFIILINITENNKESLLKYFLIQATASCFILINFMKISIEESTQINRISINFYIIIITAIAIKIAIPPLHWWIIKITKNITWSNLLILLSWQKLIPIFILLNNSLWKIIFFISILTILWGTLSQINISYIKIILTFSSIRHIGWIIITNKRNFIIPILYLLIYIFIFVIILTEIKKNNLNLLWKIKSKFKKLLIRVLIISIAGIPPLLGFLPKWITLMFLINTNQRIIFISIIIVMATINFIFIDV